MFESVDTEPAAAIADLCRHDPELIASDADVLDLVAAWDRVANWAAGKAAAATAEFVRRPADTRLGEPGAIRGPLGSVVRSHGDDELAVRLGLSRPVAARRVSTATALADRLPATRRAVERGLLDQHKATLIVEETTHLPASVAAAVEALIVDDRAAAQPPSRLRQRIRRAVLAADPAAAQDRAGRARERRSLVLDPQPDGMADLVAHLPAADAVLISTAVDAAARRLRDLPGEDRTLDQLRADCLVAPFRQALVSGTLDGADPIRLARSGGEPATIQITIPAAALLGLSDSPADLVGYGPITAGDAQRIATDARWQRLLTDDCGRLLDVGMPYRPDRATRRLVTTRDRTCRFPGCSAPARRCDLDHVVPYPDGPTSPQNLVSLCRRHHSLKHGHNGSDRAGVALVDAHPAEAELHWRLPSGHHAATAPTEWSSRRDDQIVISWTRQHRRPSGSDPPEGA